MIASKTLSFVDEGRTLRSPLESVSSGAIGQAFIYSHVGKYMSAVLNRMCNDWWHRHCATPSIIPALSSDANPLGPKKIGRPPQIPLRRIDTWGFPWSPNLPPAPLLGDHFVFR